MSAIVADFVDCADAEAVPDSMRSSVLELPGARFYVRERAFGAPV
jgi:hypothetical protein